MKIWKTIRILARRPTKYTLPVFKIRVYLYAYLQSIQDIKEGKCGRKKSRSRSALKNPCICMHWQRHYRHCFARCFTTRQIGSRYKCGEASLFSLSFWKTRNMDAKWLISVRPVAPDHTLYFHWRCVRVSCFVTPLLRFEGGIWHFWRKDLFRPPHIYCVELRASETRICCCTNQRLCMMDVKEPLFHVDISNIMPGTIST